MPNQAVYLLAQVGDLRETVAKVLQRLDRVETLAHQLQLTPAEPRKRKHGTDGWSEAEEQLLRDCYAELGAVGCMKLLPHRSHTAIRSRAQRLGISTMPSKQRFHCDQCDANVTRGQVATCRSKFCAAKKAIAGDGLL